MFFTLNVKGIKKSNGTTTVLVFSEKRKLKIK